MRRRTFDRLVSTEGLVLVPVLAVAGGMLSWARRYITGEIRDQLAAQKIYFPAVDSAEIAAPEFDAVRQYAGQQLTNGDQAKAYADHFIAVHLSEMPYKGVYSKVSAASMANPTNTALKSQVQTVFQGTTLRGLLLEAYAFWQMGQIALIGSIVSFVLAAVMLVMTGFGFWHLRRVDPAEELMPAPRHVSPATPAMA